MSLDFDTQHGVRSPSALAALVEAVHRATPSDEAHWLEWKSGLELGPNGRRFTAHANFTIAKAILGFANRTPHAARRHMDGLGYLLVGVEPGRTGGVQPLDHAALENGLTPYLGADGPVWSPQHVVVHGQTVLVIIVEAPNDGDRVFTLRKSFQEAKAGADDGAIFVRYEAQTARATSADIEKLMLRATQRARESLPELYVGLQDRRLGLTRVDNSPEAVAAWVEDRRALLAASLVEPSLGAPDQEVPLDPDWGFLQEILKTVRFRVNRESRTASQFKQELNEHLSDCAETVADAAVSALAESRHLSLSLDLGNWSDRNMPDVRLSLTIRGCVATIPVGRSAGFPERLRPFGDYQFPPSILKRHDLLGLSDPVEPLAEATWWMNSEAFTMQDHDLGHLRPREIQVVELQPIAVLPHHVGDSVRVEWEVTSTGVDGVMEGELDVEITGVKSLADGISP